MMTADEKNHVISNANEELDRQVIRLDTVFPYIAGEISEEARLGSLTHWAYSNKNAVKTAANERPRREAVSHRQDLSHALHEAEPSSRSELRREALARKPRRANADADYEDSRGARKTATTKSRGDNAGAEQNATAKRRRVEKERPPAIDMGTPMERTASGATSQRASAKDGVEKKRSRAPNAGTTGARKKYASPIDSPVPSVSFLTLLSQDQCHFQCRITCHGSLTSYRNLQCPTWSCKPRTKPSTPAILSNSADCRTDQQCPTKAVIICVQSHWSANRYVNQPDLYMDRV